MDICVAQSLRYDGWRHAGAEQLRSVRMAKSMKAHASKAGPPRDSANSFGNGVRTDAAPIGMTENQVKIRPISISIQMSGTFL